jgi:hypothetical protein
MDRYYTRLKLVFLALFALISAGLWAYNALYVWPAKACEAKSDWWDPKDRVCAVPMSLSTITGRPAHPAAVAAQAAQAQTAQEQAGQAAR